MITNLTQQQLQDILINIRTMGQETENINAIDLIQEIKEQMQAIMYSMEIKA